MNQPKLPAITTSKQVDFLYCFTAGDRTYHLYPPALHSYLNNINIMFRFFGNARTTRFCKGALGNSNYMEQPPAYG